MAAATLFSLGINVLYLAMPPYMLQVYDRVLASSNVTTLAVLTLALLLALATLAILDYVRSSVLARSGIRLENRLAARVMSALVERSNQARGTERAGVPLRMLELERSEASLDGQISDVSAKIVRSRQLIEEYKVQTMQTRSDRLAQVANDLRDVQVKYSRSARSSPSPAKNCAAPKSARRTRARSWGSRYSA